MPWYASKTTIATAFSLTAISATLSLLEIAMHLRHYSNPKEQRFVVRIIALVPVYGVLSCVALAKPTVSLDVDIARDMYESWIVYNFLSLCVEYVGGPANVLTSCGRTRKKLPPTIWACTCTEREGTVVDEKYLRRSKKFALQFVFLKPVLSVVSWIAHQEKKYGDHEINFSKGYIYVLFVYNISYSLALYGLLMFYRGAHDLLKPHRPLAKFILVKSMIFMTFWQGALIAVLTAMGYFGNSSEEGRATQDFLVCVEMVLASFFLHIAFPYTVYANKSGVSRFVSNVAHAVSMGDVLEDARHHFGTSNYSQSQPYAYSMRDADGAAKKEKNWDHNRDEARLDDKDGNRTNDDENSLHFEQNQPYVVVIEEDGNPYSYKISHNNTNAINIEVELGEMGGGEKKINDG